MAETSSETSPSPTAHLERDRNRLPTLFEVLNRRTLPPVDLFSYYIYMRDQQRSVDYLDFWLDVAQHMSLCRHYVRELRRSVLADTPPERISRHAETLLARLGEIEENPNNNGSISNRERSEKYRQQDAQMSAFLREEAMDPAFFAETPPEPSRQEINSGSADGSLYAARTNTPTLTRQDIRASAEKILYTFLLPAAEREISLPPSLVQDVTRAIEEYGRDDPEVFDLAQDYVFQAMERDAFPGFLHMKAFGNLVPPTMVLRLILGLVAMFGGFWTAFVLIFLDAPRQTRCWLIFPFTVAVYALCSYQYALDPILGLAGLSEYTPFKFSKVHEPFVRKLLIKRSFMVLTIAVFVDTALCILFILVPGKRL